MRCSGWSSLASSACSALVLVGPAPAHVDAEPAFLASGSSASIELVAHNDRDEPMTSFSLIAPPGLEIEHAHEVDGWSESLAGEAARWTGGSLAPDEQEAFGVTLAANAEPGVAELQARQLYGDGAEVAWPVTVTIVPAADSPSQSLVLAGLVGLIGALLLAAIAMLAWRRRGSAPSSGPP